MVKYRLGASNLESGFGFLSVLLALAIIGAIYVSFFGPVDSEHQLGQHIDETFQATQGAVCLTNRASIERAILVWMARHPNQKPTLAALASNGVKTTCPDKGRLKLQDNGKVRCSVHP